MCLLAWCHGDPRPPLPALAGMQVVAVTDRARLAPIVQLALHDVAARLHTDHQPYIVYINDEPVAYGWVARRMAYVGELARAITLPPRDRYLWDFMTVPAWRGRGIYPRLLQIVVEREGAGGCVWIIHAPENTASGRGIQKAGFQPIGRLSFLETGSVGLAGFGATSRVVRGAALLGVPLLPPTQAHALAPCWRCVLASAQGCSCASGGGCTCAVAA